MVEKDLSALIEHYLDGELDGIELDQFNSRLRGDPEFAKEVELQEAVNQIIKENRILEFKNKIDKEHYKDGPGINLGRIVGSVIIIILLAISYYTLKEADEVTIKKNNSNDYPVLTPNGDGQNDEFLIKETGTARIYDRNGRLIRVLSSPATWDATDANGKISSTGLYFIRINHGKTYNVTVLR